MGRATNIKLKKIKKTEWFVEGVHTVDTKTLYLFVVSRAILLWGPRD